MRWQRERLTPRRHIYCKSRYAKRAPTIAERATPTGQDKTWSAVLAGAKSIIKTVCSCIESQATTTTTVIVPTTTTRTLPCTPTVTTQALGCKYDVMCHTQLTTPDCATLSGIIQGSFPDVYSCVALCDATADCVGIYYVEPKLSCYLATSNNGYYCALQPDGYSPFADIAILQPNTCSKPVDKPAP